MKRYIPMFLAAFFLAACSSDISTKVSDDSRLAEGLRQAEFNLDSAVTIGVLPESDPVRGCVKQAIKRLIEDSPGSFTPQVSTILGATTAAYIRAEQLRAISEMDISPECKQMVGDIVLKAGRRGLKIGTGIFLRR